jgi:hypothetical protein
VYYIVALHMSDLETFPLNIEHVTYLCF